MPNKKVAAVLKKAKKLLSNSKWVQHAFAVDDYGNSINSDSLEAVGFCALGAVNHISNSFVLRSKCESYLTKALHTNNLSSYTIVYFNDDIAKGKEDVLKVYDKAIALAEGRHVGQKSRTNAQKSKKAS